MVQKKRILYIQSPRYEEGSELGHELVQRERPHLTGIFYWERLNDLPISFAGTLNQESFISLLRKLHKDGEAVDLVVVDGYLNFCHNLSREARKVSSFRGTIMSESAFPDDSPESMRRSGADFGVVDPITPPERVKLYDDLFSGPRVGEYAWNSDLWEPRGDLLVPKS